MKVDTTTHPELIDSRFACVSASRPSFEAHMHINDSASHVSGLNYHASKTSTLKVENAGEMALNRESVKAACADGIGKSYRSLRAGCLCR